MAVNVVIKGPDNQELSLADLLLPGVRYGILDDAFRLEEDKLGDFIIVFDAQNICRGFELSCQGNEAALRLPHLPSCHPSNFITASFICQADFCPFRNPFEIPSRSFNSGSRSGFQIPVFTIQSLQQSGRI